ncbi:hypothetical protein Tco_1241867, partial [Tanacetum coccineum]
GQSLEDEIMVMMVLLEVKAKQVVKHYELVVHGQTGAGGGGIVDKDNEPDDSSLVA